MDHALLRAGVRLIRATNLYGDPRPWSPQGSALFTLFSFIDCSKYPPSYLFLLMTLGPAIAALSLLDRCSAGPARRFLTTFGRVPLFYYLIHIPVIHAAAVTLALVQGIPAGVLLGNPFFPGYPQGYGTGLPGIYLAWAAIIVLLYPACRWFAGLKGRRRDWWLSYF